MALHVETETIGKHPWTIARDGANPIHAPDGWNTHSVDTNALDVVTAALHFGRPKVYIHYSQSNVKEAKEYYNTFQVAQFLSVELVQSPMPELVPKKSLKQRFRRR